MIINDLKILLPIIIIGFIIISGCQAQSTNENDTEIPAGDTAWHQIGSAGEPAFLNSWADVIGFSPCGFRKDGYGVVHLRGKVSTSTNEYMIYYLPSGYRPKYYLQIGDSVNYITVGTNGAVSSSSSIALLDGISFYAEQ